MSAPLSPFELGRRKHTLSRSDLLRPLTFCSEPQLARASKIWAKIHSSSAKLPSFVLLAISGFIMNFVVAWVRDLPLASNFPPRPKAVRQDLTRSSCTQFHKDDAKRQAEFKARKAASAKEAEPA